MKIDRNNSPLARAGIYLITNVVTEKRYIGISQDVRRRFKQHCRMSSPSKLLASVKKHGIDKFTFTPIYYSLHGDTSHLPELECHLIRQYGTAATGGYNMQMSDGAVGPYGKEFCDGVRAALSRPDVKVRQIEGIRSAYKKSEVIVRVSEGTRAAFKRPEVIEKLKSAMRLKEGDAIYTAARNSRFAEITSCPDLRRRRAESLRKTLSDPARRENMSARTSARMTPEYREIQRARIKTLKWATNGIVNRRVLPANIAEGWYLGRTPQMKAPA